MKLKVGILSPFYKNYNYGGKLQGYAMVRAVEQAGCEGYQVLYSQPSQRKNSLRSKLLKTLCSSDYRSAILQKALGKCLPGATGKLRIRERTIDAFDDAVPHSRQVYSDAAIGQICRDYDAFICGSDQVWNPMLYKKAYFLSFVPEGRYHFSYGASIANTLDSAGRQLFQSSLSGFDAISVREEKSRQMLQKLLGREVSIVADPTMLLDSSEWEAFAGKRMVEQPYLLCYFLGYGGAPRRAAKNFAKAHGLRLVTLPHMLGSSGRFYLWDVCFGDSRMYDVSVENFVSLIRYAEYVFTDSYHAALFSLIFRRQFVVFDRSGLQKMNVRIQELLSLYDLQDRRLPANAGQKTIRTAAEKKIAYRNIYTSVEALRDASWAYLKRNLQYAEQTISKN